MPACAPTNSTAVPLSPKLSATQSAGIACPPVPPPAITTRGLAAARFGHSRSFTVLRYLVKDANGSEAHKKARTAVAYKRQRHPSKREDDHGCAHVEDRLHGDHRREARGQTAAQHRGGAQRDPEPRQRDEAEGGDHHDHPEQPELLAD